MKVLLKIDFVSDVSCGWCAVGLQAMEQALRNIGSEVVTDLRFQPFELNPDMPVGGENLIDHLRYKYGSQAPEQYFADTRQRGADIGFEFRLNADSRIYNTFDAHRLLQWAAAKGRQVQLKHALFAAHFTGNKDPGDHEVLLNCVLAAGLELAEAQKVLNSNACVAEVREAEAAWIQKGVHAVPTIVINDKYVISGARSVATFEQLFRSIAAVAENRSSDGGPVASADVA